MNSQNNYNIPKTKKEKVQLLESILKGEKTIADLEETGYTITMWRQDDHDPTMLKTFDGTRTISHEKYEAQKLIDNKAMYITLDLHTK